MGDRDYNTDYLWKMKYRNDLPEVPVGPYLLEMPKLLHPLEHYGTYYQSSLEKNYVWKPHFPEAGIQLDLWDKDSFLVPQDEERRGTLDYEDFKYIQEESGGRKTTSKDIERPWWLRNTTYLEACSTGEGQKKEERRAASTRSKEPSDPSSVVNRFEKSFNDMEMWRSRQITKPDPNIVAIYSIFPDESMADTDVTMAEFLVNSEYLQGAENEDMDISNNILTNVRNHEGRTQTEKTTTMISLVAKKTHKNDESGGETDIATTTKVSDHVTTEDGELYSHVKDFRSEVEADNRTFLWHFDDAKEEMRFVPIVSTIRMKRVSAEDASWHDVYVKRRKRGEPEEELPDGDEEEEVDVDVAESEPTVDAGANAENEGLNGFVEKSEPIGNDVESNGASFGKNEVNEDDDEDVIEG